MSKYSRAVRARLATLDAETGDLVSAVAAEMGRRGGLKGGKATGASKRRGDSAYYRSLQAKRPKTYAATLNGKATRVTIPED